MTVGLCSLVVHFQSPDRVNCNGYCIFTNDFQWMITALNARFASLPLFHEPLCHILSLSLVQNQNQVPRSIIHWRLKCLKILINGMLEAWIQ